MFRVVTPAPDRSLLSIEEARAAAGVTDSSQDTALQALALAVSDMISRECGVVPDGAKPPSLRVEQCEESFRRPRGSTLRLSRRFVAVSEIIEDGAALASSAYELDPGAGILTRLDGDRERTWACNVMVTYAAGFSTVPADLKRAASMALREMATSDKRDPLLRSMSVEGVGRWDFQVGGTGRNNGSPLPPGVVDSLGPFTTVSVA